MDLSHQNRKRLSRKTRPHGANCARHEGRVSHKWSIIFSVTPATLRYHQSAERGTVFTRHKKSTSRCTHDVHKKCNMADQRCCYYSSNYKSFRSKYWSCFYFMHLFWVVIHIVNPIILNIFYPNQLYLFVGGSLLKGIYIPYHQFYYSLYKIKNTQPKPWERLPVGLFHHKNG